MVSRKGRLKARVLNNCVGSATRTDGGRPRRSAGEPYENAAALPFGVGNCIRVLCFLANPLPKLLGYPSLPLGLVDFDNQEVSITRFHQLT